MNLATEPRKMVRITGDRVTESSEPTKRETQVLYLVALGYTNDSIGAVLWVSEDTVKTHLRRVFGKLGAQSRAHAVTAAFRRGMLRFDPGGALASSVYPLDMPRVVAK